MFSNKILAESVDIETFNKHLSYVDGRPIHYHEPKSNEKISNDVWVYEDKRFNKYLLYKDGLSNKIVKLVMDPYTGEADPNQRLRQQAGGRAMRKLNRFLKKFEESIDSPCNKPEYGWETFESYDPEYCYEWLEGVYQYDMNSCYPYFFGFPLPYGNIIAENRIVNKGEIGFSIMNNKFRKPILTACFEGDYADIIFNTKIYKSLKAYGKYMYDLKNAATTADDRYRVKLLLNALHGNLKYHNIYISVAILGYAKNYMLKHKPKNCIMITIDSYTTLGPVDTLDIGSEMGQFSIEYENERFYYKSCGKKQWGNGDVKIKGLKKSHIGITKQYYFDTELRRMCLING